MVIKRETEWTGLKPEDAFSEFAPAERASREELRRDIAAVARVRFLPALYDAIPEMVLILNQHRQIVYGNKALEEALQLRDRSLVYGLRFGEALDCQHATETSGGCGTTRFCGQCGAVKSMLLGLRGKMAVEECHLLRMGDGEALDFRVVATPFETRGHCFAIFSVVDVSHEKRRQVLERLFLHDMSNTVTTLQHLAELGQLTGSLEGEKIRHFQLGVQELIEEIQGQKDLLAAEHGELVLHLEPLSSTGVLRQAVDLYQCLGLARTKRIEMLPASLDVTLTTDRGLLARILGNLLKNALEATPPGGRVLAGCELNGDTAVDFWVRNFQYIPPEAQLQIFNRSYSTKGKGRGIGTYSVKLLCERYLAGQVSLVSSPEQGTTFKVTLPVALPNKPKASPPT